MLSDTDGIHWLIEGINLEVGYRTDLASHDASFDTVLNGLFVSSPTASYGSLASGGKMVIDTQGQAVVT